MAPERFKVAVTISAGMMGYVTIGKAPMYFDWIHGVVTKTGTISIDLSEDLFILAFNIALCGWMMAMDENHRRIPNILSAYYWMWSSLTVSGIVAKLTGINLPFSTTFEKPALAVMVVAVYWPVLLGPCLRCFCCLPVPSVGTEEFTNIANQGASASPIVTDNATDNAV